MKILHYVHILPSSVLLDGTRIELEGSGMELLSQLYRSYVKDYPKFFKMDLLCKLGTVASEMLLYGEEKRFVPREDRAVLLFSRSGPLSDDRNYQKTIADGDYFPSPALFVYTLANIVTGEIAIRNKYEGDTTAFELEDFIPRQIVDAVFEAFEDRITTSAVCGWAEAVDPERFEAFMMLVDSNSAEGDDFNAETIERLRNKQ